MREIGIRKLLNFVLNAFQVWGFPGGLVVKNPPANAGDLGLIPGLERSPGEGNGNPLQYSCLGNPMDKGAWQATVHGLANESGTTWLLNKNNEQERKRKVKLLSRV